jgi:hypothetical protein
LIDFTIANQYLEHKYKEPERRDFPLPDEDFVFKWVAWTKMREKDFPEEVWTLLSRDGTRVWLEVTLAGKIPIVYTEDRWTFERLVAVLSAESKERPLPASVNAFTLPCKHPMLKGHRVIVLFKACYSALSSESVGLGDEEWLEKSATIRLHHAGRTPRFLREETARGRDLLGVSEGGRGFERIGELSRKKLRDGPYTPQVRTHREAGDTWPFWSSSQRTQSSSEPDTYGLLS